MLLRNTNYVNHVTKEELKRTELNSVLNRYSNHQHSVNFIILFIINYIHLKDAVTNDGNVTNIGQLVILPATLLDMPISSIL